MTSDKSLALEEARSKLAVPAGCQITVRHVVGTDVSRVMVSCDNCGNMSRIQDRAVFIRRHIA
eukprot:186510-Amphidinium_carterae.1